MITKKCKIFTFIAMVGLLVAICYAQDPQTNANTRDIANLNGNITVRLNTKVDKVHFSTYSANRQAEVNGKVKSVSATLPVVSSGGTTPVISLASVPFSNNSTGMRAVLAAKVSTSTTVNGQPLSSNVTVTTISGNAGTATALAANGTNCGAGQAAIGVDVHGNAVGCYTPAGTYSLPTATSSVLGGVKPDGTSILNSTGVISATASSVGALPSGGQAVDSAKLNGQSASYYQPSSTAITTSNIASQTVTTATGNAGTATKLATARAINGVNFDGTTNINTTISGSSDYSFGTWTPSFVGLVVINGTGSSVYSGTYTVIGNIVFLTAKIVTSGTCTTQSISGTTYINNPPFTPAQYGTVNVSDPTNGMGVGINSITPTKIMFMPSWSATSDIISITSIYIK